MSSDNIQSFSDKDLKLHAPFGLILAGPSSSGKTTFIQKLIAEAHELIDPAPLSLSYCYGEYNALVPELQRVGVTVFAGAPTEEFIQRQPKPALIVLDDLLHAISEQHLSLLFTAKIHHQNLALCFITQDLFAKKIKTARQNAQYLVLMRAPNAALSIRNLGVQLFPRQLDYFLQSYRAATEHRRWGYLFVDLSPRSADIALRLRTNIFKGDRSEAKSNGDGDKNPDDNIKATLFLPLSRHI